MTDYRAMIEKHSCKPNQGCGVMTICMCGVAEDMAGEIELLREALQKMLDAVCGDFGFAAAVRADSGKAYPWHPLEKAEKIARAALGEKE